MDKGKSKIRAPFDEATSSSARPEFSIDPVSGANPLAVRESSCSECHQPDPKSDLEPEPEGQLPRLSVAAGNKVQLEFQIDDLIQRLGVGVGRQASHCGGCNGCGGCHY